MSASSVHPFHSQNSKQKRKDGIVRVLLMFATYFILLCAGYIFYDIVAKGAPIVFPAVFGEEGGLVRTDIFTKDPETLYVFENEEADLVQMSYTDYVAYKGANPDAVVENEHTHSYSAGGIRGPLVGTVLLTLICIVVALAIGVITAIYLNEYSSKGRFIEVIRLAILNLAGVPSIVFGLFGLMFFCLFVPIITNEPSDRAYLQIPLMGGWFMSFQGWGTCMLAGGFTLACMTLPVIITASEESLKAVPMGFREASLALGATQWQTIHRSVLPYAYPGILTATVLGITRVAGETAPIMFTAAVAHKDKLPWEDLEGTGMGALFGFFGQSVQALPYHIYTVAARIPQSEYTQPMQYASVFVFMLLVMVMAALSVYLRIRVRSKLKW